MRVTLVRMCSAAIALILVALAVWFAGANGRGVSSGSASAEGEASAATGPSLDIEAGENGDAADLSEAEAMFDTLPSVMQQRMVARIRTRIEEFFALPQSQRTAELDRRIDAMDSGGGRFQPSPEMRQQMMSLLAQKLTPELQSQFKELSKLMRERRRQRGLPVDD